MLALFLSIPLALAGAQSWDAIYDARLLEAAQGDAAGAVALLESTLGLMDESDPGRAEVLYSLGRARYWLGDAEGARAALAEALASPQTRSRAWSFLVRLEARERRITALPSVETFEDGFGAWVRGWARSDTGTLEQVEGGDEHGVVLGWSTVVREAEDDFLFMNFGDLPQGPRSLHLELRARRFPAHVRLVLEDVEGQRWSGPVVLVGTDGWTQVDQAVSAFAPVDDPKSARRFPSSTVRTLLVQDMTAFNGSDRGENQILLDQVRIE